MAETDAEVFIDVPERPRDDIEITLPTPERTGDVSLSWADRVENGESHTEHGAQAVYPSHLVSEVNAFDGVLPEHRLGELSDSEQLRLFRLNGFPSRPCSAQFTLHDNTIDSREILGRNMATRPGPAWQTGTFVIVWDAPWELPDELISQRLQEYGEVHSNRHAYNQSLLPEKVHDGRRVLRMSIERSIPPFMKIGPFLVRIFYTEQPRVCWKCESPEHIGRECPHPFCFNCHLSGHKAFSCDQHIKCSLCKAENHLAIDCSYNWGRRTRAQRTPQRPELPADETTPLDLDQTDDDQEYSEASNDERADEDLHSKSEESHPPDEHPEDMNQEDSVSQPIDEFTSSDASADPPLPQRKRGGNVEIHPQKRSKTDENPP